MHKISVNIEDFYNFVKEKSIDLYQENIKVKTKNDDYVKVFNVDITQKNVKPYTIRTENNCVLTASKDHVIYKFPNKELEMNKLHIGQQVYTKEGYSAISDIVKEKVKIDLYDLEVENDLYFTNGILSHNSTISNALKLSLFGKLSKISLKDIPNRKNGHGEVYMSFVHSSGSKISIERRFSPNGFKLLENGIEVSRANKNDLQNFLEDDLLDINSYVFNNMISLSLRDFSSFLTITPADKRKIIDKIFSLSIYNDIRASLKDKVKQVESEINSTNNTLNYIETSIERTKQEIANLERKINEEKESEIEEINETIKNININISDINEKYDKVKNIESENDEKLKVVSSKIRNNDIELSQLKRSLDLYKDEKCPLCESDLNTNDHIHKKEETEKILEKIQKENSAIKEKESKLQENITKIRSKKRQLESELSTLKYQEQQLNAKLLKFKNESKIEKNVDSLLNIIIESENEKKEKEEIIKKNNSKKKFYSIIDDLVGDKGIKSVILSNIVPLINQFINEYLSKFEVSFEILLDENFNSTISEFGIEVSPTTLSMGESNILDFCVLMSMIKILKIKYLNLNILFLDEIFASLDSDNVVKVIKILEEIKLEYNLNVFVIHHAHLPKELFDNYIQVTKTNGFSNLEYI